MNYDMVGFLLAIIAIILGLKFFPGLTKIVVVGIIIVFLIGLINYNIRSNTYPKVTTNTTNQSAVSQVPQQNSQGPTWHNIMTISNKVSTTTDSFPISGNDWKIVYSTNDPTNGGGSITINVNNLNQPTTPPGKMPSADVFFGNQIFQMGSSQNMVKMEKGSGQYYLTIQDTNNVLYTVTVLSYY